MTVPPQDVDDAGLDARLDRLAAPAMPADLIARIVRDVPRLPQVAPEPVIPEPVTPEPVTNAGNAMPSRAAQRWSWRLAFGGGMAAIAAGVAVVALIGSPDTDPVAAPPSAMVAPKLVASAPIAPLPTSVAVARPERLAVAAPVLKAPTVAAPPVSRSVPALSAPVVEAAPSVAPQELAAVPKALVVAPVGPESGDGNDATVGPSGVGIMGPPVPQGMGYANGPLAPSMPMGAATGMPGGSMRRGPPPR